MVSARSADLLQLPVYSNRRLKVGRAPSQSLPCRQRGGVANIGNTPHTHTVSPGSSDALITHSICSAPTHTPPHPPPPHHHLSYGIHRVHTCVHTIPAQRVIRRGARRPLKRPHSQAETNISVHHYEANRGTLLTRTNQQSGVAHA